MGDNGHGDIYVGRKAICQAMGLSWKTVVRWVEKRGLPVLREAGYPPSLHRADLQHWHQSKVKK